MKPNNVARSIDERSTRHHVNEELLQEAMRLKVPVTKLLQTKYFSRSDVVRKAYVWMLKRRVELYGLDHAEQEKPIAKVA